MTAVFIVDTGVANVASVAASLRRLDAQVELTTLPDDVERAEFVVLPGVGAFGAGAEALDALGLRDSLTRRLERRLPTLCICLGMQLLARRSTEDPDAVGLGVIDADVTRLPSTARSPQMGWNEVRNADDAGQAYFANTYALERPPDGWEVWTADHGRLFPAMIRSGGVLACQFHPELSGAWGEHLIADWLGRETAAEPPIPRGPARIIPCLDVRDGRVVKGVKFQDLRDAGDPMECARTYELAGADELVVLDVAATAEGRGARRSLIGQLRSVLRIPLCVGGGLKTVNDAADLLKAGADKVAVNTAAVLDPTLIRRLSDRFGRQCVVTSIDAVRTGKSWDVVIRAGTERLDLDAIDFAERAVALGAGELLVTSFDRDGTGDGYDLDLLAAIRERVDVPVIASGGAGNVAHMRAAIDSGADAVLAATIFHDGGESVDAVKSRLFGEEDRQC